MTRYLPSGDEWVEVREAITTLANVAYPKEACGFIVRTTDLEDTRGLMVVGLDNVSDYPWARFQISEADTQYWLGTGRVIAVWHSHPADPAVPSEDDQERAVRDVYFVVYSVLDEDLAVFLPDDQGRLVPEAIVMPS